MNYPWSNVPTQPEVIPGAVSPYGPRSEQGHWQQNRPIESDEAKSSHKGIGEHLTSVLKNRPAMFTRPPNQMTEQPTEAVPIEASRVPPTTRR